MDQTKLSSMSSWALLKIQGLMNKPSKSKLFSKT